jgi:hypothetical protein
MIVFKRALVCFLLACVLAVSASRTLAQPLEKRYLASNNYFGDNKQPGNFLHSSIMSFIESGDDSHIAIEKAIKESLTTTLADINQSENSLDVALTHLFYDQMIDVNSLDNVTQILIELYPNKAVDIISLGVRLYPDFAQDVFDGAVATGVLTPEEVYASALKAGAGIRSISDTTLVGNAAPPMAAKPLGAGIGAGGTGSGDPTASNN